ncbi:TetR/AcrR family transcriptional regulator [Microbacterium thalassium]|uniref:AcrR family transcriptional regulator n=1 Tax=Microbacterium thalassium TaxID=362649 RepID=A0A7X0FSC7_9MICO|nr:TetR/AcrR family transcriptional regulator C-terminal domain-containing protein [Microbacterium thalassium]MBB6392796.1 AcrR family transcriptional regulator [Microbacterium thalassium]GLK22973.1 TetR family transcriptional regulator [Microbacterium thalassium]
MARAGLTRDGVLAAALALADRDGLRSLSMRRVAAELGVEAMSLYNHVRNKADLERGLIDSVWSEIDLARDEPDWRAALHRLAGSAHAALRSHPWFFSLPLADAGSARLAVIDATLAHLAAGGVPDHVAFHALHILDGHVYGYTWQALQFAPVDIPTRVDELPDEIRAYPHLYAHALQHLEDRPPGDGFTIGLDLILDGLERSTAAAASGPA